MTTPLVLDADAVLFDSDGVLVDSHERVWKAWSTLAAAFGLDVGRLRSELAGVPARQTLSKHLSGSALDDAVTRLEDLEVESAAGTRAVAGAATFTASLPSGRFAFVTSASRRLALARWEAAGIAVPPHVVTADDVSRGKPDPEPFLTAAAMLGVAPSRCVVFEDSDAGSAAAHAAGANVVAVGSAPWTTEGVARVPDLCDVTVGRGRSGFELSLVIARSGDGRGVLA